jgi:hypothetical protein
MYQNINLKSATVTLHLFGMDIQCYLLKRNWLRYVATFLVKIVFRRKTVFGRESILKGKQDGACVCFARESFCPTALRLTLVAKPAGSCPTKRGMGL